MELLSGTDRLREYAAALELFNNTVSDGVKILRSGKDQIGVGRRVFFSIGHVRGNDRGGMDQRADRVHRMAAKWIGGDHN